MRDDSLEELIEKIKALKPQHSDKLPARLLPLLPNIDKKIQEGLTLSDIARALGVSSGTFSKAVRSARRKAEKVKDILG